MLNNLIAANQSTIFESAAVTDCLRAIETGFTAVEFGQAIEDILSESLNEFLALVGE
jgi:hypothetical protein